MPRYMAQRTLLEGLQIPIATLARSLPCRLRQLRHSFETSLPRTSTVACVADGRTSFVFEGQIKNDRLPLGADTPKIIAQHHHRGSFAHSDGAVCDRQSIHC